MRGRLIFGFLAELYRLDTQATETVDPDGPGPLTGGYDPDFKEPVLVDLDADGVSERIRQEYPPVRIPCQVETESYNDLRMFASGNTPKTEIALIFHFKDLERQGLVHAITGDAMIRPGDRLNALCDKRGVLVQAIANPPGLFVTEASPIGFGLSLSRPKRNLLLVTFSDRRQAHR